MTDLTPNDLSHLSEDEFNALCPQGEHAPGPHPLSPAAQAVLDAFWNGLDCGDDWGNANLAAALRAAADQVVPEEDEPGAEEWIGQSAWSQANYRTRFRLHRIAAELAGDHITTTETTDD